ncbi:MAG: hypothetical protein ABIR28_06310 [Vicinamibacteria bacterium]
MSSDTIPPLVFTLWKLGVVVTLLVFVPLAVYLLHSTWRAARSIQIYAREALLAAGGIAGHTKNIPALDQTIATATQILGAAGSVDGKLDTIANVLAQRAAR